MHGDYCQCIADFVQAGREFVRNLGVRGRNCHVRQQFVNCRWDNNGSKAQHTLSSPSFGTDMRPGHRVGLYCKKERLCVIINPSPQGSSDHSQLFSSAAAIKSKGYQGIKQKKKTKPTGPSRARIQPAPPSVLPSPPLPPAPSTVRRLRSLNRHFRQVSKNLFFLFFSPSREIVQCVRA